MSANTITDAFSKVETGEKGGRFEGKDERADKNFSWAGFRFAWQHSPSSLPPNFS